MYEGLRVDLPDSKVVVVVVGGGGGGVQAFHAHGLLLCVVWETQSLLAYLPVSHVSSTKLKRQNTFFLPKDKKEEVV